MALLICALSSAPPPIGVRGLALHTGQLADGMPPFDIIPGFQIVLRSGGRVNLPTDSPVDPLMPLSMAVIVVVPSPVANAMPVLLMVATPVAEELQVTEFVMSRVLLSA